LTLFFSSSIDICVDNEKALGDSRLIKKRRISIPKKVRARPNIRNGDFLTYLLTKNGFVKIKKLGFDWDEAIKQHKKLKIKIIVKLTGPNSVVKLLIYTCGIQSIVYLAKAKEIETVA
jgi:bifunctional DNA-binding transcriptional regulator/antitoxin component of YhaV-PrlF toxin-antitoxin module